MELFDTHAHFEGSRDEIVAAVERARAAGVTRIMAVGGSDEANAGTAGFEYRAVGWDREWVGRGMPEFNCEGVSAIGEIGLDYFCSPETREAQIELFSWQLEMARRLDLPVVIHTREADDDTLGVLRDIPSRGIIHCFTGSTAFCRELLDLGFMISISGIVTFKSAENVRAAARYVPDDRILIETDSPFLAPVPMRGKPNEPAFLVHTAKFIADLRNTDLDTFAALTTANGIKTLERH